MMARLLPLGMPAPRRDRVRVALGRLSLTPAMGVIDGVHHHTAGLGPDSQPARTARLADADVFMVDVADDPDGGVTFLRNIAHFAGRKSQLGVLALLGHHLDRTTGAPRNLSALSGAKL